MQGRFVDLMAAADYLGPGAVEVDRYQTEIFDIVRRRGAFGQRIKQVPATGHPSRFIEETGIPAPTAAQVWSCPPVTSARPRGNPSSSDRDFLIVPTTVPEGTGFDQIVGFSPKARWMFSLQLSLSNSKAIVREAIV